MTQNILFPFWVISQPKVDGFFSNMGHCKGWILLGRPDTVSYRKHNNEHDTGPVSLSVSASRIFFIIPKLAPIFLQLKEERQSSDDEDKDKYVDRMDMVGTKVDEKER